jgi:hypothetical protein
MSYINPYWNTTLSSLHKDMKLKRNNWILAGKPRTEKSISLKEYKSLKTKLRCANREVATFFLQEQEAEIDTAAECDNNEFWRLINHRRNKKPLNPGFKMCFNGTIYSDPLKINTENLF